MVPNVKYDVNINGNNVTLTLSWREPFNNFDPIVSYTVSCSGDVTCPSTTTDNTTRSYTITNLTPMTNYTFSVVATNSIGSGEAGVLEYTTSGKVTVRMSCYGCISSCVLQLIFKLIMWQQKGGVNLISLLMGVALVTKRIVSYCQICIYCRYYYWRSKKCYLSSEPDSY